MKFRTFDLLAGVSLAAMVSTTFAQTPETTSAAADNSEVFALEEIVVTARRKDESLQDVPQTVNAVTSETLDKLNILNFADVQAVTPGLNLAGTTTGYSTTASMRGVSYTVESGGSPTVATYLNDAPVESNFLFQSMYDVGQIEVLRGPQGTLRGRSAPSGALTMTVHKPNLSEIGGYGSFTATSLGASNGQGAFNLPLVSDVLAIRLAALNDQNDVDGVHSVSNTKVEPSQTTKSGRVSVRFEPNDAISANVMYQRLTKDLSAYDQVVGAGHTQQSGTQPASGYNGPVISASDRLGITDGSRDVSQQLDYLIGQLDWRFAGQKVSYVGGWTSLDFRALSPSDKGNLVPGFEFYQDINTKSDSMSQELRLSSEERVLGLFDYTVGAYYKRDRSQVTGLLTGRFLNGSFGTPLAAPVVGIPNPRYSLPININNPDFKQTDTSVFASLTWHITDQTELTGGARYIVAKGKSVNQLLTGSAFAAAPVGAGTCAFLGGQFQATYTGVCDIPVAAGASQTSMDDSDKPTIYSVSISHHFNDDLLVYANTGTSWRAGPTSVGVTGDNTTVEPLLSLINHKPEKSTSYEAGVKWQFLDKRGRLNVSVYHQKFDGYFYYAPQPINYVATSAAGPSITVSNFVSNVNAVSDGVDMDTALQITERWNASLAASYAKGKVDNDTIPCNDSNFDGIADTGTDPTLLADMQARGLTVSTCKSNASLARFPKWNASLQSEYSLPVTDTMDSYVRGLLTYYPKNDQTESGGTVDDSYNLLNLYVGIRDPKGVWDLSVFGKNVGNTSKAINGSGSDVVSGGNLGAFFGNTGYRLTSMTPRREFGASIRYAFGSR